MLHLSDELLLYAFSMLDCRSLAACELSGHRLHFLVKTLLAEVMVITTMGNEEAARTLQAVSALPQTITTELCDDDHLESVYSKRTVSSLRTASDRLEMGMIQLKLSTILNPILCWLAPRCPNLVAVSVEGNAIPLDNAGQMIPVGVNDAAAVALGAHCSQLQLMLIPRPPCPVSSSVPSLEAYSIRRALSQLTDRGLESLARCRKLCSINLRGEIFSRFERIF